MFKFLFMGFLFLPSGSGQTMLDEATPISSSVDQEQVDNGKNFIVCPFPPEDTLDPCVCLLDENLRYQYILIIDNRILINHLEIGRAHV